MSLFLLTFIVIFFAFLLDRIARLLLGTFHIFLSLLFSIFNLFVFCFGQFGDFFINLGFSLALILENKGMLKPLIFDLLRFELCSLCFLVLFIFVSISLGSLLFGFIIGRLSLFFFGGRSFCFLGLLFICICAFFLLLLLLRLYFLLLFLDLVLELLQLANLLISLLSDILLCIQCLQLWVERMAK